MNYDAAQVHNGDEGAAVLDVFFARWYRVTPVSRDIDRIGIDRLLVCDRGQVSVEYKSDNKSAETGNVFIEVENPPSPCHLGWAKSSCSQYIAWYLPPAKVVVVETLRLRASVPVWGARYKTVAENTGTNNGYQSRGILVPIAEVEKIGKVFEVGE